MPIGPRCRRPLTNWPFRRLKLDPSAGIFSYSNAGIGVVGSVIERVTGKSFTEVLQERILTPPPAWTRRPSA